MQTYYFYKLSIKNTKLCYIGSTTNVNNRINGHKTSCNNYMCGNHYATLYKSIRENGGWENVESTVVGMREFLNRSDAMIEEQKYIVKYKANLNMVPASTTSLNNLIEQREMTPTNSIKRNRLATAIWKKTVGKEKYNEWQKNYMRKKQAYTYQARLLRYCLISDK